MNIHIIITKIGLEIPIEEFQAIDNFHKILSKVTINSKQFTFYKKVKCYRIKKNKSVILPRAFKTQFIKIIKKKHPEWTINIVNTLLDNEIIPNNTQCINKPHCNYIWSGKLLDNQQIIHDHYMKYIFNENNVKDGNAGSILKLEAGQGKSFITLGLIATLKIPTLIITHNTTILLQWKRIIESSFKINDDPYKVGLFYGKEKYIQDITIAIINSAVSMDNDILKRFKFIVFDEVHEYCSKERSEIFWKCQSPYMLGLSATPEERTDSLEKIIQLQIGPILDAMTIPDINFEEKEFMADINMIKYIGPSQYTHIHLSVHDTVFIPKMIEQLTQDPYRTQLIINNILTLYNNNHNIFIFADRRTYLEQINTNLTQHLIDAKFLTNEEEETKLFTLLGGMSENDIEKAEVHARVILTTYQFMGTGKSIPKMDAVIFATPRKTKGRQYVNRIFRLGGDETIRRQVIDIVDWATPMKSQWYERRKYYIEKNYPINEKKIKYSEINLMS